MTDDAQRIDAETAAAAVKAAAWRDDETGTERIHSMLGGFGADHDLEFALQTVASAAGAAWVDHPLRHDLAVKCDDGRVYYYDVPRPERSHARIVIAVYGDDAPASLLYRATVLVEDLDAHVYELDDTGGWAWHERGQSEPGSPRREVATKAGWGLILAARERKKGMKA